MYIYDLVYICVHTHTRARARARDFIFNDFLIVSTIFYF